MAGYGSRGPHGGGGEYRGDHAPQGRLWGGRGCVPAREVAWGDVDGQRWRKTAGTVDMVFGGGRNTCPGRTIALMEINKLIPEVRQHTPFPPSLPTPPFSILIYIYRLRNMTPLRPNQTRLCTSQ